MKYLKTTIAAVLLAAFAIAIVLWQSRSGRFERPTSAQWIYNLDEEATELVVSAADVDEGELVREIIVRGSPTLERLEFRDWPALESFKLVGDFPELETVELVDVPELKYLAAPYSGTAPRLQFPKIAAVKTIHPSLRLLKIPGTQIGSLERLPLENRESLKEIDVRNTAVGDDFLKSLINISSLYTLRINGCDKISLEARYDFRHFWRPAPSPNRKRSSYYKRRIAFYDSVPKVYSWPIGCCTWCFTSQGIIDPRNEEELEEEVERINSEQIENALLTFSKSKILDQLAARCPGIKRLKVHSCEDIGFIGLLENLEMLCVDGYNDESVGFESIGKLKKLRALSFNGFYENIMPVLSRLAPTLEDLDLTFDTELSDLLTLQGLKNFSKLRRLYLSVYFGTIDDLSFLEGMPDLEELHIDNISPNADLSTLTKLIKLKTLELDIDGPARIPNLSNLDGLEKLRIRAEQFNDLSGLNNMESLRILHIQGKVSASFASMRRMTTLERLVVSDYEGDVISLASDMKNLQWLIIDNAENLQDISSLTNHIELTRVSLGGCKLENLSPLANMLNLEIIQLCVGNSVDDFSILRRLKDLRCLCIDRFDKPLDYKEKDKIRDMLPRLGPFQTTYPEYRNFRYWR